MLTEALINRHNIYNEQRKFVEEEEQKAIFCNPTRKTLNCPSMERDITKLESIYQLGYLQDRRISKKSKNFVN